MKKNAFTLIELLATVVILVVVFMIITPKLTRLVKDQETKQKELLKEKLISSAKEYANDYDKYFFDGIKKVGDSNTVTIKKLIEAGLIDEDETKDFNEFYGVKAELKDNDRIEYTLVGATSDACFVFEDGAITGYNRTPIVKINKQECVNYLTENKPDMLVDDINLVCEGKQSSEDQNVSYYVSYYTSESDNLNIYSIDGYDGCESDVVIPKAINGVEVTEIGENAFYYYHDKYETEITLGITSVFIPNTVTNILDNAFYINKITDVTIPNSVIYIGNNAFYDNQLTSINIPKGVTTIGESAFAYNELTNVAIPDSVTTIGVGAFSDNKLQRVTIPSSITSIEDNVFSDNELTNITIPNSVTSIGGFAFGNNRLTSLIIPNSVTYIGWNAFFFNQLINSTITFPTTPLTVGCRIFESNYEDIIYPSNVTEVCNE